MLGYIILLTLLTFSIYKAFVTFVEIIENGHHPWER